jgi:dihydrofolate reductase
MTFDIIVAMDQETGIGQGGALPWNLPGDMKHFKEITSRTKDSSKINAVIMGRKTWDSIPEKFRPLPGRVNVVITRNPDLVLPDGVLKAESLDNALAKLSLPSEANRIESVFVIGGAQIFKAALAHPGCQKIHLTHISQAFSCDTFFPEFKKKFGKETYRSESHQDGPFEYCFAGYERT